ncbi:MAG: hypothetical protein FJ279_31445, partial [Planctomycetes bacterium]|nr:hypothetical protein [Planctomycetota bacterium]
MGLSAVGAQIIDGRYRILRRLGQGGMGAVFLAEDLLRGHRRVALKTIKPEMMTAEVVDFFKHEFHVMTRLSHPNLAEVYDFGSTRGSGGSPAVEGQYYFTLEFISGTNLFDATRAAEPGQILDYLVQTCLALEYLHSRGLIHYDVKPENILVADPNGRPGRTVKLLDFGLCSSQVVRVKGTPYYMAPEMLRGERVDIRADLYSLGIVLYQVLTRRLPFRGQSASEVTQEHLHGLEIAAPDLSERLPEPFGKLVARLVARDPNARFSRPGEVIEAINGHAGAAAQRLREVKTAVASPDFVGREREFKQLTDLLAAIKSNPAQPNEPSASKETAAPLSLVLVSGEGGVGKTRLLREFKYHSQLEGAHVLEGMCLQGRAVAYEPVIQVLRQALALLEALPAESRGVLERNASKLAKLTPEVGQMAAVEELPKLRPADEKLRMIDAATDFLVGLSAFRPYVVGIEDLQWADDVTVELLQYLARNARGSRLLVCATCRDDEIVGGPLQKAISEMAGQDFCLNLRLERLSPVASAEMIQSMLALGRLSAELTETIAQEAGGNPFFIEETLRYLVEEEKLRLTASGWQLSESNLPQVCNLREVGPMSSRTKDVLNRRLARLDGEGLQLLKVLAVFNRPVAP